MSSSIALYLILLFAVVYLLVDNWSMRRQWRKQISDEKNRRWNVIIHQIGENTRGKWDGRER